MELGFIGLGDLGAPMADRLWKAGWPLHIWARRQSTLDQFRGTPVKIEDSPAAVGGACDFVGLCVTDDSDVRSVVLEQNLLSSMRPGSVLAIHSTVTPGLIKQIEDFATELGVLLADAPISGTHEDAADGNLNVLLGAAPEVHKLGLPVWQAFAKNIFLVGPTGTGQVFKVLNNTLLCANRRVAMDAIELADRLGLDGGEVARCLVVTSARSYALESLVTKYTPAIAEHAAPLLKKDVGILRSVCDSHELYDARVVDLAEKFIPMLSDGSWEIASA
jgi:3-hydroxyisobutyrate dehydrogenase-like beta-hydroxyacid dehydrogenase